MSSPDQTIQPDPLPPDGAPPAQVGTAAPAALASPIWRWLTLGLLLLGVVLTALFALRAIRSFRTFHAERGRPPREAMGDIAPWMTIPYVAAAYQVPEAYLYAQLGIEPQGNERKSLMRIERAYFNGERGLLRDRILAALELYYADSAIPTPIAPDPASIPKPEAPPSGAPGDPNASPPDAAPPDAAPPDGAGLP